MQKSTTKHCVSVMLIALLSFTSLTATAHRDERFEQALASADPMTKMEYQRFDLLGQLGHKLVIIGREEQGRQLITEALSGAGMLEHPLLRDQALHHLANEVASTGAFDQALALREEIPELELRTKLGWKLVNKLGKAGRTDEAQALLDEMLVEILHVEEDLELRAELLAGTGANHRFTDHVKGVPLVYEAYGLAQSIPSPYKRGLFFNEIGANLMDIKHRDRAVRVFERSRGLLEQIESPLELARFLAMLGGEQAEKGKRDAAARDLELGVKAAQDIPAGEDRNDVLSELARNFGQSYRFKRGIEVADSIPDPFYRAEGYIRIAKNMHRQGEGHAAIQLLEQTADISDRIESPFRRGIILRKLASEWINLKDYERAGQLLDQGLAAADALKSGAR